MVKPAGIAVFRLAPFQDFTILPKLPKPKKTIANANVGCFYYNFTPDSRGEPFF